MSIKKIVLGFALAGIVGASTALAETDGAFVGVQLGYGGLKSKSESSYTGTATANIQGQQQVTPSSGSSSSSISLTGVRFGIMGGYKQFFTPEFGARYYGVIDFGTKYKKDSAKVSTTNISANADALYNFISKDDLTFGAFGGLSLGYASHKADGGNDAKINGFDLGINLGVRAVVKEKHGIEFYTRFGVLQQKKDESDTITDGQDFGQGISWSSVMNTNASTKLSQPYQIGVRYVFSF